MDKHLDRWRDNVDELAAAIGNPPALKTVELTATPCDRSIDGAMEFHGHDATREEVKRQVVGLIEHAERGRFVHELHRAMVMRELQAPVLVIAVHHDQRAKLHREDPSDAYFDHGERAGTAYLFEPDGKLVCAGAFEATSSDQVEWTKYTYGHETEEEKRGVITDGDDISVRSALDRDLDKRMHQALAASLKRVQ